MSDPQSIDWEQLSMIFGDDDDELDADMAELFQEFVEDGNQRFQSIKMAPFPEQKELIAKESHKLKGSASNFGFTGVASLLGHIEDDIAVIDQADFESSLADAISGFDHCIHAVMARYPALKTQGC